ncbi:MAG: phosphotransferase family protein, partial [Acidimicrobiia bacterium]
MSKPSPEGLLNLARTIASGARPKRVRRLGGGIGSATHAITFERRDGSLLHVVLKRYPKTNDSHAAEWKALHTVAGLGVPSPEPLAHDPEGDWFGDPALAMTKVSGKPNVDPNQIQPWVEQIAETLLTIQGAPLS